MTADSHAGVVQSDLNRSALEFLGSEFSGPIYCGWPIEKRLEVYLRHRGKGQLANDGAAFEELLQRVLVNFGRARREGLLAEPRP